MQSPLSCKPFASANGIGLLGRQCSSRVTRGEPGGRKSKSRRNQFSRLTSPLQVVRVDRLSPDRTVGATSTWNCLGAITKTVSPRWLALVVAPNIIPVNLFDWTMSPWVNICFAIPPLCANKMTCAQDLQGWKNLAGRTVINALQFTVRHTKPMANLRGFVMRCVVVFAIRNPALADLVGFLNRLTLGCSLSSRMSLLS